MTAAGVRWDFRVFAAGLAAAVLLAVVGAPSLAGGHTDRVDVVVRGVPGAAAGVADAVERLGGEVRAQLGILNGVAAEIPSTALAALRRAAGVAAVTLDSTMLPLSDATVGGQLGSLPELNKMVGAPEAWRSGVTGAGVDVAVIDTGMVPVEGLTYPGKVMNGPDLSFESQVPELAYLDGNGHGTAMGGIIAGRDNAISDPANPGTHFQGLAPGARLVNIKVGAFDGAVDVSQVIAAVDWVVQNRNKHGLNIRVLNLSYGTDSTQDWSLDPLSYAVDVAWRNGIVVVASTGNDGKGTQLAMPAANPNIIAVGASDHVGTATVADDKPASFSNYANGSRRPDLMAPGVKVLGLNSPGSYLASLYPGAVQGNGRFFRGSGSSQSAAVVSGAAALLLQQRPNLTPDQVKAVLRHSATRMQGVSPNAQGAGVVNVAKALTTAVPPSLTGLLAASGVGSIDASRGTHRVAHNGVTLAGEQDIFAKPFVGATWAPLAAAGASWGTAKGGTAAVSTWNGSTWTGASWGGASWGGASWGGASWGGASWGGASWGGASWGGASWGGAEYS